VSISEKFLILSCGEMRVSAIFGLGSSERDLRVFSSVSGVSWISGLPVSSTEADAIVLFGGDGTIHRHLADLIKLQLPVLVVPYGSGNDFARALGLRRRKDSLAAWQRFVSGSGRVRAIDIGIIKNLGISSPEKYFCTVAGVGIDGEVCRRVNSLPRWLRGNGGYALTVIPTLFRFAPVQMKISFIGDNSQSTSVNGYKPFVLAAFANVPAYGGGMKIAPRSQIDDGQLDVCLIGDINKFKLFCVFPTIYFGGHLGIKEVEYRSARKIEVDAEHPLDVYADGEFVCKTPVEVTVKPRALKAIV
jgi:diacylglycerol kinase (ATP)